MKLQPAASLIDSLAAQFAAGTAPHVALRSQSDCLRYHEDGAFTEITDDLWGFPKASPATRSVWPAGPPSAAQESLDTPMPDIAPYASECRWPLRAFGLCNVHRTIRRWREVS